MRVMASAHQTERNHGSNRAWRQITVLREKWPIAFPTHEHDVRLLAIGAVAEIAAAMNWSLPYTPDVLSRWKMRAAYRKAILRHDHRISLDGSNGRSNQRYGQDLSDRTA
jgi:hypothetical protein